uniref:Uncharacterized protein n=1 Tax=Anguilla anguilla TaxID=7936 RepID=A0A0E9V3Q6_ANGAN
MSGRGKGGKGLGKVAQNDIVRCFVIIFRVSLNQLFAASLVVVV